MISKIYTEDWFNRSTEGYTFDKNDMGRGIVKVENHKYSSFLYNEDRAERICTDTELLRKEMVDMIHAVGLSNVAFNLSEKCETAQTNGYYIEVGVGDDYKNISDCYEKLDRVIGMTIHECCHCLYTDFSYVHKIVSSYPSIVHHIHNVIEDEIIEQKLINKYPGYENFLAKLKYNLFDKKQDDIDEANNSPISDILSIFFYIVRYPKYLANIDENILNKYESIITEIKKIMDKNNCFAENNREPTVSSTKAAIEIYELLDKFNSENSEKTKSNNSNKKDKDNGESNQSGITISNEPIDMNGSCEEGDFGEIAAIIAKILEEISSESEQTDLNNLTIYHNNIEESIKNIHNFEWKKCKDTRIDYNEINIWDHENITNYKMYLHEAAPYIAQAKSLIINNRKTTEMLTTRFNRNGTLDPTRLANAMCNEQNVYLRKDFKTVSKDAEYALVIMIDESGSMNDKGINRFASKIAIMLYEAILNYPKIKLFVYGHGDCVYKYIDCDKLKNKFVLGDRRSQGGQDELRSYKLIVDDVKKYTNLPIVMFNITDSCYCTNEQKLANLIHELREDPEQQTFINLICLGHNASTNNSVTSWNNIIYGEGNWVLYNQNTFSNEWSNTIKKIAKIIHRTVKIK